MTYGLVCDIFMLDIYKNRSNEMEEVLSNEIDIRRQKIEELRKMGEIP